MVQENKETVGAHREGKATWSWRRKAAWIAILTMPIIYATVIVGKATVISAETMRSFPENEDSLIEVVEPSHEFTTATTTTTQATTTQAAKQTTTSTTATTTATTFTTVAETTTSSITESATVFELEPTTQVVEIQPAQTELSTTVTMVESLATVQSVTESTSGKTTIQTTEEVTTTDVAQESTEPGTQESAVSEWWGGITEGDSDYILLCNAVGHEAGADAISEYNKAMVVSVILNRVEDSRYPSTIYDVLAQKGQFSGARGYIGLGTYSGKVSQSVKNAVTWYLSEGYLTDNYGYLSFWGDGRQNHFS